MGTAYVLATLGHLPSGAAQVLLDAGMGWCVVPMLDGTLRLP